MPTFLNLPRDRQIELYERAARQAIAAYEPGACSVQLVSAVNNATFKVTFERDGARRCFALRVHRPGKTTPAMLDAELRWLVALRQDTTLCVPSPMARLDGTLRGSVEVEGSAERFDYVLFRWIDATFVPTNDMTPAQAREIGRFVALLHQHSQRFSTTPGLTRRRLDADQFFDWAALQSLSAAAIATPADALVFEQVAATTRTTLAMLGTDATVFGMIHTDLIAKNYFFTADGVGTLDFDDCSWGAYAYDMAATLIGFADEPSYEALRVAYLVGYREIRRFSVREEQTLDTMMAARHLLSCCWIATHLDDPAIAARAQEIIAYRAGLMQRLLHHGIDCR